MGKSVLHSTGFVNVLIALDTQLRLKPIRADL
jgi:hypothetical protein